MTLPCRASKRANEDFRAPPKSYNPNSTHFLQNAAAAATSVAAAMAAAAVAAAAAATAAAAAAAAATAAAAAAVAAAEDLRFGSCGEKFGRLAVLERVWSFSGVF